MSDIEQTPEIAVSENEDSYDFGSDHSYSALTSKQPLNIPEKLDARWDTKHIIKVVLGAGIGSFLEFYGFGLVGYFESEIALSYFPNNNDSTYNEFLEAFTVFGIAFIMRPIGGLLFGYIGDKYGRVYSLRLSLIGLAISTFLFGVIPNYSYIGFGSTILCFFFRYIFLCNECTL